MNISIEQMIEHSCVISIDSERLAAFRSNFNEISVKKQPRLFNGFKMEATAYNGNDYKIPALNQPIVGLCFTHASIVLMAQFLAWPYVCIFEDDAVPCKNIISKLNNYLNDIPDNTSLLKLGMISAYKNSNSLIANKFFVGMKTWGSHAYIVFKQGYDSYLKIFQKHIICDHEVFNDINNILITKENLFIQKNINNKTISKMKR